MPAHNRHDSVGKATIRGSRCPGCSQPHVHRLDYAKAQEADPINPRNNHPTKHCDLESKALPERLGILFQSRAVVNHLPALPLLHLHLYLVVLTQPPVLGGRDRIEARDGGAPPLSHVEMETREPRRMGVMHADANARTLFVRV